MTVNSVRQALRRRRWRRLFAPEDEGLERFDSSVPDEAAREKIRGVYRALGQLNPDDRTALVLRHLFGYELSEVAEAMGCSLATLKRWLSRAEEKFGRLFGTPMSPRTLP